MKAISPKVIELVSALSKVSRDLPATSDQICQLLQKLSECSTPHAAFAIIPLAWPAPRRPTNPIFRLLAHIPLLIEPERETPSAVHTAAANALNNIMVRMPVGDLPSLDHIARSYFEGGAYGRKLQAAHHGHSTILTTDQLPNGVTNVHLLGLLASHPDGHLREAAVRQLMSCHTGQELPYLTWRTVDWVPQVRNPAIEAVRARLRPEAVSDFTRLLPLLERMDSMSRVNQSRLLADIRAMLLAEPTLTSIAAILESGATANRHAACRLLDQLHPGPPLPVLQQVANDADPLVRSWALRWAERIHSTQQDEVNQLIRQFTRDPFARLRLQALYALVATDRAATTGYLREAILDRSVSVQEAARYYLRSGGDETDFAATYRKALAVGGAVTIPAIIGLAATGSSEDWELLRPFMTHTAQRARAALRTMTKLNRDACRTILFEALVDERAGVRKDALLLLTDRPPSAADALVLEALLPRAGTTAMRGTIADAMLKLPPWTALTALLAASSTDPDGMEGCAVQALARWRPEHRAYYAPLPPDEVIRQTIERRLADARRVLPPELLTRLTNSLNVR